MIFLIIGSEEIYIYSLELTDPHILSNIKENVYALMKRGERERNYLFLSHTTEIQSLKKLNVKIKCNKSWLFK